MKQPRNIDDLIGYIPIEGSFNLVIHLPNSQSSKAILQIKDSYPVTKEIKKFIIDAFSDSGFNRLNISLYDQNKKPPQRLFTHLFFYDISQRTPQTHLIRAEKTAEPEESRTELQTTEKSPHITTPENRVMQKEVNNSITLNHKPMLNKTSDPEIMNALYRSKGEDAGYTMADFYLRKYNEAEREINDLKQEYKAEISKLKMESSQEIIVLKGQIERQITEIHNLKFQNELADQRNKLELLKHDLEEKLEKSSGLGGLGESIERLISNDNIKELIATLIATKMGKGLSGTAQEDLFSIVTDTEMKDMLKQFTVFIVNRCKDATEEDKKFLGGLLAITDQEDRSPGYLARLLEKVVQMNMNGNQMDLRNTRGL